ncbi:MAG: histidinol-phosphate transaminase [Chloroflexota bacterium]|nr:histidinol-phosphate transaminase [Chloroflexota bacterium]
MPNQSGNIDSYYRPHVRDLEPYVPPEALEILAYRAGLDPAHASKLDFNENPYGPSPRVIDALASMANVHLYPDPIAGELRGELASYTGTNAEDILIGAGADELISLLVSVFIEPGDVVVDLTPTYSMYGGVTLQHAGRVVHVPRGDGWTVDVPAVLAEIEHGAKIVWVCSPNNPTGSLATEKEVVPLLETGAPVVLDEAYYEFSRHTFAPLIHTYPNLIVLRTFSKLAGLAGLRIAYMLASRDVLDQAHKVKLPFNTTLAGQVAATAALRDRAYLAANLDALLVERERLVTLLREQGELDPYPSDSNFLLCRTSGDAPGLHRALAARGVFVRHFPKPRIDDCLRISVGRPEDTDRLLAALEEVRPAARRAEAVRA